MSITPYWQSDDGRIVLYHGDALEVLPELGAADHVITDPPYSKYVHGKSRVGGRALDRTGYMADYSRAVDFGFEPLTEELRGAIVRARVQRWSLVFSDVESSHLWREALVAGGRDYVRTGAWHKLNATPQFTGDRPAVGFEAITICHEPGRKRWNSGGKAGIWTHAVVQNRGDDDPRVHATQKPISLMRELVADFTDRDDLILDPCAGSGTTLRAAYDLGRRAIGIELNREFCDIAIARMRQGVLL